MNDTALMALLTYGLSALGLSDNVDTSVIGALMLLVPGILFTNALREIIFGDANSGINRVVEVLLIAAALGTAAAWHVAVSLWGAPVMQPVIHYSPLVQGMEQPQIFPKTIKIPFEKIRGTAFKGRSP